MGEYGCWCLNPGYMINKGLDQVCIYIQKSGGNHYERTHTSTVDQEARLTSWAYLVRFTCDTFSSDSHRPAVAIPAFRKMSVQLLPANHFPIMFCIAISMCKPPIIKAILSSEYGWIFLLYGVADCIHRLLILSSDDSCLSTVNGAGKVNYDIHKMTNGSYKVRLLL